MLLKVLICNGLHSVHVLDGFYHSFDCRDGDASGIIIFIPVNYKEYTRFQLPRTRAFSITHSSV